MNLLRNILHAIIETIQEEVRWRKHLRYLRELPAAETPWTDYISKITFVAWQEKAEKLGKARYRKEVEL